MTEALHDVPAPTRAAVPTAAAPTAAAPAPRRAPAGRADGTDVPSDVDDLGEPDLRTRRTVPVGPAPQPSPDGFGLDLGATAGPWLVTYARRRVAGNASSCWATPDECLLVELLASEVVTNAVAHGPADGQVGVRTAYRDGVFSVMVSDESPELPVLREPDPTEVTGRGLHVVTNLATAWGVEPGAGGGGKTVWFTFELGCGYGEGPRQR